MTKTKSGLCTNCVTSNHHPIVLLEYWYDLDFILGGFFYVSFSVYKKWGGSCDAIYIIMSICHFL